MKKIILIVLLITSIFLIASSKEEPYQKIVYDIPNEPEIYFCETDADCGHVKGCNENGGSPCINKDYVTVYGHEKRNCDPEAIGFCYICECINNKCTNIIDKNFYGC